MELLGEDGLRRRPSGRAVDGEWRIPRRIWSTACFHASRSATGSCTAECAALSPGVRYVTDDRCPRRLHEDGFCLPDSPGPKLSADRKPQCGAVSFIQRFDSALRLNPHIHIVCFDGIYAADEHDRPHFQALPAPETEAIARVTASLHSGSPGWLPVAASDRRAIRKSRIPCPGMSRLT